MQNDTKIYIIGQGIAGSVLAYVLNKKGYALEVIDDGHQSASGMVAAGMWNPVSFKRMSQSWMADELLPAADRIYREMEMHFNAHFYHPLELVKIFPDHKSANQWDEYSTSPELGHYLSDQQDASVQKRIKQPFGHGVVTGTGWLDIPQFLQSTTQYLKQKNLLRTQSFTAEDLKSLLANEENKLVILATGWCNADLFSSHIQIIPNKGEVLTIECKGLNQQRMLNFGKFLIPLGNDRYRAGTTYNWEKQAIEPTEAGKQDILSYLRNHIDLPIEVIQHQSGYRPTTRDRRPILGLHPENSELAIFNGFGSKGVMLIPYFAEYFIQCLESGQPIMKEVSATRYFPQPTNNIKNPSRSN